MRSRLSLPILLMVCWLAGPVQGGSIVVIGHPGTPRLDPATVERIFTGKVVEVDGVRVTPANIAAGNYLRSRFLRDYLNQDEERYNGYWTVRRYVGKGMPPRELNSAAEMINYVSSTPGAVGYIDEADLKGNVSVLLRK